MNVFTFMIAANLHKPF